MHWQIEHLHQNQHWSQYINKASFYVEDQRHISQVIEALGDGQDKYWTRIRRKRRKWKLCFPLQPALLVRNSLNKKPPGCEADTNDHKAKEGSYHSPAANPEDAEEPDFFVKITVKLYCKQRFKSLVKMFFFQVDALNNDLTRSGDEQLWFKVRFWCIL